MCEKEAMAAAPVAVQAVEVDWEAEGARATEEAMVEIARRDPGQQYLELKRLREIPTCVFELSQLTILYLGGDERKGSPLRLSVIPSEIGQLTNLESLNIAYNALSTLPESLSQLTRMRYLTLRDNGLTQLPAGIGNLHHVEVRCVDCRIY